MARGGNGELLITDGWGTSVAISNGVDGTWRVFEGPAADRLRGPHGVCVDGAGWTYVADSLNSRLIRFREPDGSDWAIFPDIHKRISYGLQLLCRADGVWLANSYERREGLNPGDGANILRLDDFLSGEVTEVTTYPKHNITGLAIINEGWIVVGLFNTRELVLRDVTTGKDLILPRPDPGYGPPYGMRYEPDSGRLLVTYTGDIHHRKHTGGVAIYRVRP